MSVKKVFLYRCPICGVTKVESEYREKVWCRSEEHEGHLFYLGEESIEDFFNNIGKLIDRKIQAEIDTQKKLVELLERTDSGGREAGA